MLDLTGYAFDVAAVPFMVAAMIAFGVGAGFILYERFTRASQWLFGVALVVTAWLLMLGMVHLAVERSLAVAWFDLVLAMIPLTVPLVYGLALEMTGRRRRRLLTGLWIGAVALALTAAGPLLSALSRLLAGDYLSGAAVLGWIYVLFLAMALAGVVFEFVTAFRSADSTLEQRRHLTMIFAVLVAGLGFADFFVSNAPVGLTPFALTGSLVIMALGGARLRAFSLSTRFGTDEVLRAIGDAVLVCDATGNIRVSNAAARRMLGTGRSALWGSSIDRWLDDASDVLERSEQTPVRDLEMTLRAADGTAMTVSVSIEAIRAAGRAAGAVIVARDIRSRLKAQRELEASQRRYASLFWHNPALLYEFDLDGRVVAVNPALEEMLGIRGAEVRGRPFNEFVSDEDQADMKKLASAVLAGEAREYEVTVRTARGERRRIRGVTIPIFEGPDVVGVFGVALDVTEESRIKHELEVQRRYFADLFNSSPEGIVLVDPDTDVVLRVNEEFTRMFGYTSREALGRRLTDLIVPEDRTGEGPALNRQARSEGRIRVETVRRRKDGSAVDVSVLARELRIPGEPRQLYGVYRDITHRKETERALTAREEELRHAQRLEAVGKLAGGIAHDFNNLLTVINGQARFALDTVPGDSPVRSELREIERAGSRAAALTQQLLAYSRRQRLHPRVLELNAVVRDLQGMLRRLIGEHIQIETRLTDEDVRVRADRGQLEQVVINLVVNARDAMPDGGTLTLTTDLTDLTARDHRLGPWEIEPGEYVRLRVGDDGGGMNPETLEHAFEPFFTTKEQGKGTGLGLSTVFGIVKQSDGHVVARSEPGRGTTVDVFLPRSGATQADRDADPVAVRERCPGGTVLVVEDEEAVRKLAVKALERVGCTVLSAPDGVRALDLVDAHDGEIHLVVTDLVMPEMGGRELAEELQRRRPDLPVLFMSGYDDAMVDEDGTGPDFLAKPFTPAKLAERVAAAMAR
ncbi:MAG: PAS domain S-box protein [Candidatus Longimicrobiales bacterium M2_2A_002]